MTVDSPPQLALTDVLLMGLARTDFFSKAALYGPLCLSLFYEKPQESPSSFAFSCQRFQESFAWKRYHSSILYEFAALGIEASIEDNVVSTAWDSFPLTLDLKPPQGVRYTTQYLHFPHIHSLISYDLPSLFAMECCRFCTQGGDSGNIAFFLQRRCPLNLAVFKHVMERAMGKSLPVTHQRIYHLLKERAPQLPLEHLETQ